MNGKIYLLVLLASLFIVSCFSINQSHQKQKEYLNYPINNINKDLNNVFPSLVMPQCYVTYRQYNFKLSENVTKKNIDDFITHQKKQGNINRQNSVGSGIIIASQGDKILILSAAHIYNYPQKIYHNFNKKNYQNNISVFAQKVAQKQYIVTNNEIVTLEKLVQDKSKDIVLLMGKEVTDTISLAEIQYKFGNSSQIEVGNYIYLFGFPTGKEIISNGIISPLKYKGEFIINTPFNKGMSGGAVFGLKESTPQVTLELLGIANSAAAKYSYLLTPEEEARTKDYNRNLPYRGNIFIKRKSDLKYGITYVTGINSIKNFLIDNRKIIEQEGFNLNHLIGAEIEDK